MVGVGEDGRVLSGLLTSGLALPSWSGPRPEKSDTSSIVAPNEYRMGPEIELPTAIAFFPAAGDITLHSPGGVLSPAFPAAKRSTCPGCFRFFASIRSVIDTWERSDE